MSRVACPAGPRHAGVPLAGHPPAPPADLSALDPAVWPRGAQRAGGVLTLPVPRLVAEPGRAIAGPGTVTLYEVGTVKDVDGLRTYVSVDGGMSDNTRTAPHGAEYICVLASRESAAPAMLSRLVGRHRGNGDVVVRDACLPADLMALDGG